MNRGFVAGIVKKNGRWYSQWIAIPKSNRKRHLILREAREHLAEQLSSYCGGAAAARRNMVLVDAMSPYGRELLEGIFATLRDATPPSTE